MSLKLWFVIKNLGRSGFGQLIDARHKLALDLAELIENSDDFLLLNKVDINSVAFMYKGDSQVLKVEKLNYVNRKIHSAIIEEGEYHLHQFSVPDSGIIAKNEVIYPLRFMSGNPNATKEDLVKMLEYVRAVAHKIEVQF